MFMHSSVVGHLGGFYILDMMNMTALNICLQILLGHMFLVFEYICRGFLDPIIISHSTF